MVISRHKAKVTTYRVENQVWNEMILAEASPQMLTLTGTHVAY